MIDCYSTDFTIDWYPTDWAITKVVDLPSNDAPNMVSQYYFRKTLSLTFILAHHTCYQILKGTGSDLGIKTLWTSSLAKTICHARN